MEDYQERNKSRVKPEISFVTSPQHSRKVRVKSAYNVESINKLRSRKNFSMKSSRQNKMYDSNNFMKGDDRKGLQTDQTVNAEISPMKQNNNFFTAQPADNVVRKPKKNLNIWEQVLAHKLGYEWKNVYRMLIQLDKKLTNLIDLEIFDEVCQNF